MREDFKGLSQHTPLASIAAADHAVSWRWPDRAEELRSEAHVGIFADHLDDCCSCLNLAGGQ
jgi:hypothetical protein